MGVPPPPGGHDLAGKADLSPRGGGGTRKSFIRVGSALLTATPLSGKSKGKTEVFQGQGKVRENLSVKSQGILFSRL